jgi:hypothetical protein
LRNFEDELGRGWSVSVGRESWGSQLLLFSPRDGQEGVRKSALSAGTPLEAAQELEALSLDQLRSRLAQAEPWS